MEAQCFVDQLRKLLTDRGHILPTKHQRSDCRLLNQGEYLVSLLCHDRSLAPLLNERVIRFREEGEALLNHLASVAAVDFDTYVDAVKFIWLHEGVSSVLQFIADVGYSQWTHMTSRQSRQAMVDELASLAERKLRSLGVKHRDMAEFFASPQASLRLLDSADTSVSN